MILLREKIKAILGIQNAERLIRMVRFARGTVHKTIHNVRHRFLGTSLHLRIRQYGRKGVHTFFGYYDVTPFDTDEQYLLATRVSSRKDTSPSRDSLAIGYFDLMDPHSRFFEIGRTTTWCWQQGCRLQWFPHKTRLAIIYNCIVDNQYGSVIRDISSKEVLRAFPRPIYAIDSAGRWALSLNFSRLQWLRPGYGYANLPDKTEYHKAPDNDGIWRIDLQTGQEELLLSLNQISQWESLPSMSQAVHYFNHLHFNPFSTRLLMFHVWVLGKKRYTRLITADLDGRNLFPLINEGQVSHYAWKSETEILAFSTDSSSGAHYHLYQDHSHKKTILGKGVLDQDGHPSFSPDGSMLLTDTYPDKNRHQHLLLYNLKTGRLLRYGSFFSPMRYFGEHRCDLHPRWSPQGRKICFDSVHEGMRSIYVRDLSTDTYQQ